MQTPHDTLFAATFGHAHHAGSWLRCVLPRELAATIDWKSLQPIHERFPGTRLRPHLADAAFAARLSNGSDAQTVLLVLEHKSYDDPNVRSQLLRYSIHLQRALQQHTDVEPFVLPILLLHNAPRASSGRAQRPDRRDQPGLGMLLESQPRQTLYVDNLDLVDERTLGARHQTALGALTLLCLKTLGAAMPDEVPRCFERWQHLLRAVDATDGPPDAPPLGPDAVDMIGWYALAVSEVESLVLAETFARILQRNDIPIMSTLERTFQKGRAEGLREGLAEGLREGLAEGVREGRADTLLQQLLHRFGPLDAAVTDRVRTASLEQLELWTKRVLDAHSLAALFDRP